MLGIWGDPAVTGKPVHGDPRERKKTLPVLAALDGPSPAAGRLAALLKSDAEPARVVALIEEAGGRTVALAEARRHIAAVETVLAGVPMEPAAERELRSLLDFLVRRDL
ncbi:hypothetical protein [Streptomyces sp. NPDC050287]|uniref:hypothetical protein n=1 Tax=Streptomyces sp. NPDC050287 TaxID=3365608 RepID=UPI0037B0FF44